MGKKPFQVLMTHHFLFRRVEVEAVEGSRAPCVRWLPVVRSASSSAASLGPSATKKGMRCRLLCFPHLHCCYYITTANVSNKFKQ